LLHDIFPNLLFPIPILVFLLDVSILVS
jgi:hypothetical protein